MKQVAVSEDKIRRVRSAMKAADLDPAVAMNDIIVAEAARDLGTTTTDIHPLKKLV